MHKGVTVIGIMSVMLLAPLLGSILWADEKPVVGWVERVRIFPGKLVLEAKLDTGADNSSLSASEVNDFEKNGQKWVKFSVRSRYGQTATIEKEVRRVALIKRPSTGKVQKRDVIRLGICLGGTYMEVDVNLVDRTNFDYQMLLGRSFLAGHVIIDPASTFLSDPDCSGVREPPGVTKVE